MSAESGVATFRDADGLWSRFDRSQLATPEAFARDPVRVWEWYRQRRAQLRTVEPHQGHRVLAAWERRFPDFSLVTQNVDGLHARAGSQRVIELHGRLDVARCRSCPYEIRGLDDLGPDPLCPECGDRVRPGVIWFGEMLPFNAVTAAFDAAARCDLILVIGTSGVVYPAAGLVETARAAGASAIEINPNESALSSLSETRIAGACGEALAAIDRVLWRRPEVAFRDR